MHIRLHATQDVAGMLLSRHTQIRTIADLPSVFPLWYDAFSNKLEKKAALGEVDPSLCEEVTPHGSLIAVGAEHGLPESGWMIDLDSGRSLANWRQVAWRGLVSGRCMSSWRRWRSKWGMGMEGPTRRRRERKKGP